MNPERWLQSHSYGYGYDQLSEVERKAIGHFCLLWSLCELKCFNRDANPAEIVRSIELLGRLAPIDFSPFVGTFNYFRDRYYDGSSFNHKFGDLRLKSRDRLGVEAALSSSAPAPQEALTSLMLIINRLRNNLLHGEKWAYSINGQLANFQHANDGLMLFMELHQKNSTP